MALSREEVSALAEYARIALDAQELEEMTNYLNDAIEMLEPIRQFGMDEVEPTFHPIGELSNVMADDKEDPARNLSPEEALKNAAATVDRSFRVPSILGTNEGDEL